MSKFIITTDSCSDLPINYCLEHNIKSIPFTYFVGSQELGTSERPIETPEIFYGNMRLGRMAKTSQINPETAYKFLSEVSADGIPVLHISFSSGLSGTYNGFRIAADRIKEENPEAKIYILDSLCASLGQGLLVDCAVTLRDGDYTVEDAFSELENLRPKIRHLFTVDDLNYLYRGGRVSKMTAVFGGVLQIKPMLHVVEGRLVANGKVRGRAAALKSLALGLSQQIDRAKATKFFISHGDCYDDAVSLAEMIKGITGIEDYMINWIGPVIGSHSGPGALALFFIGI